MSESVSLASPLANGLMAATIEPISELMADPKLLLQHNHYHSSNISAPIIPTTSDAGQPASLNTSTQVISSSTMTSESAAAAILSAAEYSTINYNGVIGYNATDPYTFTTTETRLFDLPAEIQVGSDD